MFYHLDKKVRAGFSFTTLPWTRSTPQRTVATCHATKRAPGHLRWEESWLLFQFWQLKLALEEQLDRNQEKHKTIS